MHGKAQSLGGQKQVCMAAPDVNHDRLVAGQPSAAVGPSSWPSWKLQKVLSPVRNPLWRWQQANDAVRSRRRLACLPTADPALHRAVTFLRHRQNARSPRPPWSCLVETAERLAKRWTAQRLSLECGVLAGCDSEEMCTAAGISREVVDFWEALFFDVRPYRDASSWIAVQVIRHLLPRSQAQAEVVAALRTLSYRGGPAFVAAVRPFLAELLAHPSRTLPSRAGLADKIRLYAAIEGSPFGAAGLLRAKGPVTQSPDSPSADAREKAEGEPLAESEPVGSVEKPAVDLPRRADVA